jgi:ATP synthase F1 gamma subunit
MKRASDLATQEAAMATLVELTSVFEGIASMRISQIKNQVLQSTKFFNELWSIYSQLDVSEAFSFGRAKSDKAIDKELFIIITGEGGLSGDIDQKLVQLMLRDYDRDKNDIVVVGRHGAMQLAQHGVSYNKYFKLPTRDRDINVLPLVGIIRQYKSTKVYYQEYISLMVQDVRRIELSNEVKNRGQAANKSGDVINESTYIFEPSTYEVAAHLERSMMQIALSQLILQSKLAQYASRFRAMSASHERADEGQSELHLAYNRARRAVKDERLKEMVNGLKKARIKAGS